LPGNAEHTAGVFLEVVPSLMRAIRREMRRQRSADLSIPQFRTLLFIEKHKGASLSEVAEFIGLTLPAMSKLTDGLVNRQLVSRESSRTDRRRITLSLTPEGASILRSAKERTQRNLAKALDSLSPEESAVAVNVLRQLADLFANDYTEESS
jgi:DNA-binding MarR family transcriptional regulator